MSLRTLLALALLAGCTGTKIVVDDTAGGPGETGIDTDDTGEDTVVSGAVAASPASLDFGVVFLGQTGSLPITVTNVGDGAVELALSQSGASTFTYVDAGSPAPGASVDIFVTYTPTAVATDAGSITITDTLGGGEVTVSLSGKIGRAHV